MKKNLLAGITLLLTAGITSVPMESMAYEIVAPGNLQADVKGTVVNLSWEWGNAGKCVLSESFEGDEITEPWQTVDYFSYDEFGNWMLFDFSEEEDPAMRLCHDGVKSAILMMGVGDDNDPASYHQDEWLVVSPGTGAVYMDFWYFLHPELLEVGGYQDFPDHYYVQISRDNGDTWEELWDGRWDMGNSESMQQASLFLGEEADENTLVAFHAVSADEESLYFLWAIDDVEFYTAEEAAQRKLEAAPRKASRIADSIAGKPLMRKFTPRSSVRRKAIGSADWLNNGNVTYRIYLDDEMISDYLKARYFTDLSTKEPGEHTYHVMAWSEALDKEYEAAELKVNIEEFIFPAARNLQLSYEDMGQGKYSVTGKWDAPEGDIAPDYYMVYINGKSMGWIESSEELSAGQTGLYKGVYTMEVEARYEHPEGASARISAAVFPGTIPTPLNITAKNVDAGNVAVSWEAPLEEDHTPEYYKLYRGDALIADNLKALEFVDEEAPVSTYNYSVHAVYADGEVSLPAVLLFDNGEAQPVTLPLEEKFTNGHLPMDWFLELIDPYERVKDMYAWRFDNWFDQEIPAGSGLEEGFASVNGLAAGMNRIESYLYSPSILLPADESAAIAFVKYFNEEEAGPSGPAEFFLEISEDGGISYQNIADLCEKENGEVVVSLQPYAGKTVMLRWGFLSRNSGFAAIDNVRVFGASSVAGIESERNLFDVITLEGLIMARGVSGEYLHTLPSGIYLLRYADGHTERYLMK